MTGKRAAYRLVLGSWLMAFAVLFFAGQAWAAPFYAGNYRNPGYGVKASIKTPTSMPYVSGGVAFNFVSNYDGGEWLGAGWAQGDGYSRAPDGVYWPTVPTSYEESNCNGYYFERQYSAQPLNYARTYEALYTGSSGIWQVVIAGAVRDSFGPFTTPTLVEALTELGLSTQPRTRAVFTNVQYKGQYMYFNFDQNWERQDYPPYASFSSYYNYTCWNGM